MSWSVPKPADSTPLKSTFDKVLDSAIEKGILIFCSSGDRGDLENSETYPGARDRKKIFRIAGATSTGEGRHGTPKAESFDFLLPGEEVFERRPNRVSKLQLRSGSSVATALASGLAALVFHIIRLGALYHELYVAPNLKATSTQEVSVDAFNKTRSSTHAAEHMRTAFRALGINENNHKLVEVWSLLERFQDINDNWKRFNQQEMLEAMRRFANILIINRSESPNA